MTSHSSRSLSENSEVLKFDYKQAFCATFYINMVYRWCIVPSCKSTSLATRQKIFISVPRETKMRNLWLETVRRDPKKLSKTSNLFVCEDHFNLHEDMHNYMEWKMMGVHKLMKKGVVPHKFDCQPENNRTFSQLVRCAELNSRKPELFPESLSFAMEPNLTEITLEKIKDEPMKSEENGIIEYERKRNVQDCVLKCEIEETTITSKLIGNGGDTVAENMVARWFATTIKEELFDSEKYEVSKYVDGDISEMGNVEYKPTVPDCVQKHEIQEVIVNNCLISGGGDAVAGDIVEQCFVTTIKEELSNSNEYRTSKCIGRDAFNMRNTECKPTVPDCVPICKMEEVTIKSSLTSTEGDDVTGDISGQYFTTTIQKGFCDSDEYGTTKRVDGIAFDTRNVECKPTLPDGVLVGEMEEAIIKSSLISSGGHAVTRGMVDQSFCTIIQQELCDLREYGISNCVDRHAFEMSNALCKSTMPDCVLVCEVGVNTSSLIASQGDAVARDIRSTNISVFRCPQCPETFTDKKKLDKHKRIHLKCEDCGIWLTSRGMLRRHRKTVHLREIKTYKCHDCAMHFDNKKILNYHQTKEHGQIKPYNCPNCNKCFVKKFNARRPVKTFHD